MTSVELKKLFDRQDNLANRFRARYLTPFSVRDGTPCFQAENGHYFLITAIYSKDSEGDGFIVIEHAHSLEEAMLPRFEDGDQFYVDDMTEDEMFEAMVREIENG